jgi:tetrahydromethanopterin S-methyltransferase subunit G
MSELDSTSSETQQRGFFSKLVNGDFGLAKTYWLYGFVVGLIINVLTRIIPSLGALAVILAVAIPYQIMVLLGVWRAADKYQGRKAWAILAKIATVLGWLGVLGSLGVLFEILGYL